VKRGKPPVGLQVDFMMVVDTVERHSPQGW